MHPKVHKTLTRFTLNTFALSLPEEIKMIVHVVMLGEKSYRYLLSTMSAAKEVLISY